MIPNTALNRTNIVVFHAENDGGVHFGQKIVSGSVGAFKVVIKDILLMLFGGFMTKNTIQIPQTASIIWIILTEIPQTASIMSIFRGFRALWTLKCTF